MAPSQVASAYWTRQSPNDLTLHWSAVAGASYYQIGRQVGAGAATVRWKKVFGTKFVVPLVVDNKGERFRIRAVDKNGAAGAWSDWTHWFYSPPPALKRVTWHAVSGDVGGSPSFVLQWSWDGVYFPSGAQVERSDGQTWLLGNGTSGRAPDWFEDDTQAGANISYRVRGFVGPDEPDRRVFGAWSEWQGHADYWWNPNPPRLIRPVGLLPSWQQVVFGWQHSSPDKTTQRKAEVRWRDFDWMGWDPAEWTTETVTGSAQSLLASVPVGSWLWQVRTWGYFHDPSEWSDAAVFQVASRPTVTISSPDAELAVFTARWETHQAEGIPQSSATVTLLQGNAVLETRKVNGAAQSVKFRTVLANHTTYSVRVEAVCSGLKSVVASRSWTTNFLPPTGPIISGVWDEDVGAHFLTVGPRPASGSTKPTVKLRVDREAAGGWETIKDGLSAAKHTVRDFRSASQGSTRFRAVAFTAEDATAQTTVTVQAESQAFWLAAGPVFDDPLKLLFGEGAPPPLGVETSRERSVEHYAGRSLPVAYVGEQVEGKRSFSGVLVEGDPDCPSHDVFEGVVSADVAVHLLRSPDGRVSYLSVDSAPLSRVTAGLWQYSVEGTQVESPK